VTSLIREKWQPAWLAGNLKLIRYKRALTSALVKFSLKTSYFHFFISQWLVAYNFEPEYSEEEMTSRSQHSITEASSADGVLTLEEWCSCGKFKINKI
jgi:hypothetical protein